MEDATAPIPTGPIPTGPIPHAGAAAPAAIDLEAIAADLADVEIALARLESGSYFTDEVTGEDLPEAFLAEHPTARTRSGA